LASPRSGSPKKNFWSVRDAGIRPLLVNVRDEVAQANYIVEHILESREAGTLLKHQAVLFRTSHHSGALEVELTRRNIPFVKFCGLKFLEAAHIKDLLSLLRWAEKPRDRAAGFRVTQLLEGVGPTSAARVLDRIAASADPISALTEAPAPPRAGEAWDGFVEMANSLRAERSG